MRSLVLTSWAQSSSFQVSAGVCVVCAVLEVRMTERLERSEATIMTQELRVAADFLLGALSGRHVLLQKPQAW